jgi:DNA-binding response OmpR family regulator
MGVAALARFEDDEPAGARSPAGPRLRPVPDADGEESPEHAPCVLLVEDDPSMRMVCQVNLESEGFRVVVAADGAQGLALAAAEEPDVVLLDVMLPDLGGFEVAERLQAPVVFLSARTSDADVERGRELGAMDYLTKPFDPTVLPARLREDLDELDRSGSAERVWQMRFGSANERGA